MTLRLTATVALLTLLAGCSVGPDHVRPEVAADMPGQWARPTLAEALPDSSAGDHWRWWESFADTTLNSLVEQALAHNNDLAAAAGRVLEAEALLGGAKAGQWPAAPRGARFPATRPSASWTPTATSIP
jgi:outer membrane protein TolC